MNENKGNVNGKDLIPPVFTVFTRERILRAYYEMMGANVVSLDYAYGLHAMTKKILMLFDSCVDGGADD